MACYVGLWTIRIPTIKDQISTDYFGIGLIFTTFSIGSVISMILANNFIKKFSTKLIIFYSMVVQALLWIVVPFINNIQNFMILSFVFGACYGLFEIAVNLQASNIEKREKKSLMSGFHGFWSLGILFGSITTSLFLQFNISFISNNILYVIVLLPLSLLFTFKLNKDATNLDSDKRSVFFIWPILLFLLVFLAITNALIEGGIDGWGALYMRDAINVQGFMIGIATVTFNIFMVLGRFTGDYLRDKIGVYKFLNILLFFMLVGLIILMNVETLLFSILGFSILGFGASSVVPIAYSLASKLKGIDSVVGITIVSIAVYGIFMVAPAALGVVANLYGISSVFVPMFAICVICIIPINIFRDEFNL